VDELSRTLYDEIRQVAARQLGREMAMRSICATDLAHEAIERAIRQRAGKGVSRSELLKRVARLCRQVLVDRARARGRLRRGEGRRPIQLEVGPGVLQSGSAGEGVEALDLIALDEALGKLAGLNPRHASIVEMRFFGGSSMPEIAAALELSLSAIEKEWRKARAWLALELEGSRDLD